MRTPLTIKDAMTAHTELCLFDAIVRVCECGDFKPKRHATVSKIIALCKSEQARCLRDMDRAVAKIS